MLYNSTILLAWVLFFSTFWGCFFGISLSLTNLAGKEYLKKLLYAPLALPLYVSSFIYLGVTEYGSPPSIFMRQTFGIELDQITLNLGPMWIGFIFSLYLSPYLSTALVRAVDSIGVNQWPVAKTLGLTDKEVIKKILLPGILPWFTSALMIISMEVLSDFGGVSAFNYETLSTGIYTAWTGLFSYGLALKIALILIFINIILFGVDKKLKGSKDFSVKGQSKMSHPPIHVTKTMAFFLYIPIIIYFFLTLIVPSIFLIIWSLSVGNINIKEILNLATSTTLIGFSIGIFITLFSFAYSYFSRHDTNLAKKYFRPFELMGYSLPGPIVAISCIGLIAFSSNTLGIKIQYSGFTILLAGLTYRYLFVGERVWASSFIRINESVINTAKVLGLKRLARFKLTFLPIFKKNIVPIFILLFLEIIKELPITLMLRPFGLNTLSTTIYELTSEGEWEKASISALMLLALGIPLTIIATKWSKE